MNDYATYTRIYILSKQLTNHIHIVEVELDFDGCNGLDNGVDDGDQHKEEHDKVHVANSEIFFLETDLRTFFLFTFSFLKRDIERPGRL